MRLESGYRFCNAPRFHLPLPWADRIRVNGGGLWADGRWQADDSWRPATDAELAVLLGEGMSESAVWEDAVTAFAIPAHLQSMWWDLAAAAETGEPDLGPFAQAFVEFGQFKRLPVPPRSRFEVVVTPPGRPIAYWEAVTQSHHEVAGVNLGDERTSVILLNRKPEACPGGVAAFLQAYPAYPLVRVLLEPGEGLWFPPRRVARCGYSLDKTDLDIWLNVLAAPGFA
jgi:hypothetical protein